MDAIALIRQATPQDAAIIAQLAERTFRETFGTDDNQADLAQHCAASFSEEIQRQDLSDPNVVILLAEVAGEPAAFAQIRLRSKKDCVKAEHPLEIYRFYVSGQWHGKGVAQAMMERVFAIARQSSADIIWLGVWEHNPRAIAFYKKYGFQLVGEHIFQFGSDPQRDLIMQTSVDTAIPKS